MCVVLTRLLCGIGPKMPFPESLLLHLKDWDSKGYHNYFSMQGIKILKWMWNALSILEDTWEQSRPLQIFA